jgi:serine protease
MNKATAIVSVLLALSPVLANGQSNQLIEHQPDKVAPDKTSSSTRYIVVFNHKSTEQSAANTSVFDHNGFSSTQANNLINSLGGQTIRALPSIDGLSAQLTKQQLIQLRQNPQVALIEPDPLRTFQAEVKPYGIEKIQADLLSDANTANIKICIPDTGIALGHEDLPGSSNITGEVSNTLTEPMDIGEWSQDTYGHG